MRSKRNHSNTVITIGADMGYGFTKSVSDQDQHVLFPSVWGHAVEIKFKADEIGSKYPGDQITDEDGSWFVGDLALSQLPVGQQRKLRGRTAKESEIGNVARLRLLKVALAKMFKDFRNGDVLHFKVATGLPVDHMRDAGELKEAFIGQHQIISDVTNFVANITDVMVMPQPYGTIYRNILTPSGEVNPCHTYTRTAVVDIGTYTTDAALDDDGEYIDQSSGSVEIGFSAIENHVAAAYERDFRQKPSVKDVQTIIKNRCVRAFGDPVDYRDEVESGTKLVREAVINLMNDKWGNAATIDVIYVSGGGAPVIFPDIKRLYPQARLTDDSQTANAQGYLNYARFASRDD